ncbi:unnamed protein product [Moneuplotes crassus]|uniref:Hexose transporter 1 n=1 Tax=Euplotes crassus TaxID=5936 RepID=A0AAD1UIM5_EUPCR|nr:unnamed protein product [Moneuplotes crassus]
MRDKEVNKPYLVTLAMTAAIGFLLLGYCFAYFNAFTDILHKQYVQNGKEVIKNKNLFNSIVSGLVPFGAIIGSVLVGLIVGKGRRLSLLVVSSIFVMATASTMIFNIYALIGGRLIMGVCIGSYASLCPLFISEISPPHLSGLLGVFNQMGACSGILLAFSVPFAMPLPDDVNSNEWRYIFGLPAIFALVQIFLFLFVFKYDTPLFYKKNQDQVNFDKITSRIYLFEDSTSLEFDYPEVELEIPEEEACLIPKRQPLEQRFRSQNEDRIVPRWTSGYKRALVIGSLLSLMQQLTGINSVTFFSSEIFSDGKTGNDAAFHARIGTLFVGFCAFCGTGLSIPLQKYFGRVSFIQISEIAMCISLALCGVCAGLGIHIGIIAFTLVFTFMFNFGFGQALWIYSSEILDSYGCSIVALINMTATWIFGTFSNLAFKYFTSQGVYFGLATIQIFTITFVFMCVKETKGKSKQECEQLYCDQKFG